MVLVVGIITNVDLRGNCSGVSCSNCNYSTHEEVLTSI